MALLQEGVGDVVQRTGSYRPSIAVAGLVPLLGLAALLLFWGTNPARQPETVAEPLLPPAPVPLSEAIRPAAPTAVR
jgi:hypothetical protein